MLLGAGYMQMTQEQVEEWSQSPDQYVVDEEEETFSVRVSGELVLDELMDAFPEAAAAAVAAALHRRLQEAAQAKASLSCSCSLPRSLATICLAQHHLCTISAPSQHHRSTISALLRTI